MCKIISHPKKMLSAIRFNNSEKLMNYYLPRFLDGGRENGYSADLLEEIFMTFWQYGNYTLGKGQQFEKTIHKYQIAYLKAHYPKEYQLAMDSERASEELYYETVKTKYSKKRK